eukprot:CAMPEP_0197434436 /NCGR_PEP_ID=MMETSP1175-20131217/2164_1 /TAXON_ID=1003142 /ORGANISM="Triceratium dubium, Strain CCMP147" /LENGTH=579 /DNA_ID=CAMNT_0042963153 /DNA_START=73 /DNA_END=1812 /DNA_ORIENTATION=+
MVKTSTSTLLVVVALANTATATASTANPNLRWASSGGGWRSMVADMGYANIFQKAGFLGDGANTQFGAISTSSGGSWFSTQLFYDQFFFDKVTFDAPNALYDYVREWMQSYYDYQQDMKSNPECDVFGNLTKVFPALSELEGLCNIFVDYNGSWAVFVEGMLQNAPLNNTDFVNTPADPQHKIASLASTDLLIQTSLTPVSRIRETSELVYITPSSSLSGENLRRRGTKTSVYAVPIGLQYAVKDDSTLFYYAIGDMSLETVVGPAPEDFAFDDYRNYFLYPPTDGTVLTSVPSEEVTSPGPFDAPFGGSPTVSQVAAASSATIGDLSGVVNSVLAQYFSTVLYSASENKTIPVKEIIKNGMEDVVNVIYQHPMFVDIAVCSEWPSSCGETNGRLIDGSFTDGTTVALNVGQLHSVDNGNLNETMKLIVTSNNYYTDTDVNVLMYFDTNFNEDVAPGDFIWAPATGAVDVARPVPFRSPQVFETYLNETMLENLEEEVPGTNLTTAVIEAVTTENAAFGIKKGQKVEILLLKINSNIPTTIIGKYDTNKYITPLSELAETISSSGALLDRVNDFLNSTA